LEFIYPLSNIIYIPEKIKKYFAMLLNWDKHKYDEVRKEKPVIEEKKKQKK
jgi:hypothetical protein